MQKIYVRVKTEEQLKAAMAEEVCAVITATGLCSDESLCKLKSQGKNVILDLPEVLRENKSSQTEQLLKDLQAYDGVVVKTIDEIGLIKGNGYEGIVIADPLLYAYNPQAVKGFKNVFPEMIFIAPAELNDREIDELVASCPQAQFISRLYGRERLMITAQNLEDNCNAERKCSMKNLKGDEFFAEFDQEWEYSVLYSKNASGNQEIIDTNNFIGGLADLSFENGRQSSEILKSLLKGEPMKIRLETGYHERGIN